MKILCFDLSKILVREYLQNPIFIDLPYFGEAYGIIFWNIYIYIILCYSKIENKKERKKGIKKNKSLSR